MAATRLQDKVAVVVGAGQTPGDTIGNGRATAILFAREGARVLCVDRDLARRGKPCRPIRERRRQANAFEADITREADCQRLAQAALAAYGRIDVLHNNVGIGGGDAGPTHVTEDVLHRIFDVNLKGLFSLQARAADHARAALRLDHQHLVGGGGLLRRHRRLQGLEGRGQRAHPLIALGNARYGIRANAIMPGLMNTPMAIEGISAGARRVQGGSHRERDARVPLGGKMGTAWDVAYAALFLASDEARFITGVVLPVDGGQSARIG